MKPTNKTHHRIAIDGNEANVANRVGSNVYAYELIKGLFAVTRNRPDLHFTVLLRNLPGKHLPPKRSNWQYAVIGPSVLWTQWALPLHLFQHKNQYDIFFTPGHYAPLLSPIPYISSVMDTAYLDYPEYFKPLDLLQLTAWTAHSVKRAQKVIVISRASKKSVIEAYDKKPQDVIVAYPAVDQQKMTFLDNEVKQILNQYKIKKEYVLYVGTIQPRKNIITLVEAYELLRQQLETGSKTQAKPLQLVLAGKIGWLSRETLIRIENSPFSQDVILTGFISEQHKHCLYSQAAATVLLGLHEGFGIPPLESLLYRTVPVVANSTSLPEVVGDAGILVDPEDPQNVADGLKKALSQTKAEKKSFEKKAQEQLRKFNWEKSVKIVLKALENELKTP